MKLFVQNNRCPSQVLFAFDEIADAAVLKVRWAVAYSTRSGCERLVQRVSSRIGKKQWEKIEKHFVTSLDFGLTEPAAIEFLDTLPRSSVHIANPGVIQAAGLMPQKAYHPKLYLFDARGSTGYVVGSANLTNSALITNTEVVAVGREKPSGGRWNDIWAELLLDTVPLTPALLAEYRRKWKRPKKRPVDPDPKPVAPAITPAQLSVFWGAVEAATISPMEFNHIWLEAGSMSSGGSHNQLELPRGANRFFGFTHTDYGPAHRVIGVPILSLNKREWTDRPFDMAWAQRNGANQPSHIGAGRV